RLFVPAPTHHPIAHQPNNPLNGPESRKGRPENSPPIHRWDTEPTQHPIKPLRILLSFPTSAASPIC
ncbi:MAG: hypothetical protein KDA83_13025, partial [Planctomycetales bacterium]|nr:hypothetical protein [Planctomycetales bacterium]